MFALSIRFRVAALAFGMSATAVVVTGSAYLLTEGELTNVRAEAAVVHDLHGRLDHLSTAMRDQEAALADFLLVPSDATHARFEAAQGAEAAEAEMIRSLGAGLPGVLSSLSSAIDAQNRWHAAIADPAFEAAHSGELERARFISQQAPTIIADVRKASGDLATQVLQVEGAVAAREQDLASTRSATVLLALVTMVLAGTLSIVLLHRWLFNPISRLLRTTAAAERGEDVTFASAADDEIGTLSRALDRMRVALRDAAGRANVLNEFTELTTFAPDDGALATSSLSALRLLVEPTAAVIHLLNSSRDRAVPVATLGEAQATLQSGDGLSRCPGVVRGSVYMTADVTRPLAVHCPVYVVDRGTLACVPLAHKETVGAVHLYWDRPNAFPLDLHGGVTRIAEHAALEIGNRRLMTALQGMADTDPRTGLANTRGFDRILEEYLVRLSEGESAAVLMLDLDHFKLLNDRHGHPAGDEALRGFSAILRSCLREHDVAARYGGEEFAVLLRNVDDATGLEVAERIRSRLESAILSLGPGVTDRITVSIGVAFAPRHGHERVALLQLADRALYAAKQAGRNRVVSVDGQPVPETHADDREGETWRPVAS